MSRLCCSSAGESAEIVASGNLQLACAAVDAACVVLHNTTCAKLVSPFDEQASLQRTPEIPSAGLGTRPVQCIRAPLRWCRKKGRKQTLSPTSSSGCHRHRVVAAALVFLPAVGKTSGHGRRSTRLPWASCSLNCRIWITIWPPAAVRRGGGLIPESTQLQRDPPVLRCSGTMALPSLPSV
jgi:hypothetical protein